MIQSVCSGVCDAPWCHSKATADERTASSRVTSAHTFLLGDEANQDTDGVFVQVIGRVGTTVT